PEVTTGRRRVKDEVRRGGGWGGARVLGVRSSGEGTAQGGNGPRAVVREARLGKIDVGGGRPEQVLLGRMDGEIRTKEAHNCPHHLDWDVSWQGEKLRGILYATGSCPARGFLLPHWVELKRSDQGRN